MIVDKKGKLFGKLNLLDVLIVAVVVLAVLAAWAFLTRGRTQTAEGLDLTYTVEVVEQDPAYFEHIVPGEPVEDAQTKTKMGTVRSVETYPAELIETNATDGSYHIVHLPNKLSGRITIASDTAEIEYPDILFDGVSLKIGKMVALRSNSAAMHGFIVGIDYNKEVMGGLAQ